MGAELFVPRFLSFYGLPSVLSISDSMSGLRLARGLSMTALGLAPGLKSRFAYAAMGLAAPQSRLLRGLNP